MGGREGERERGKDEKRGGREGIRTFGVYIKVLVIRLS